MVLGCNAAGWHRGHPPAGAGRGGSPPHPPKPLPSAVGVSLDGPLTPRSSAGSCAKKAIGCAGVTRLCRPVPAPPGSAAGVAGDHAACPSPDLPQLLSEPSLCPSPEESGTEPPPIPTAGRTRLGVYPASSCPAPGLRLGRGVPARPGIYDERGGKDPSGLASKVTESRGRCIDEGGLAERAGLGVSARPGAAGKTKDAGNFSCRILGGREVGRVRLRKGKEVRLSAQEQSACAARFHLGMGGRGGAPRVAARTRKPVETRTHTEMAGTACPVLLAHTGSAARRPPAPVQRIAAPVLRRAGSGTSAFPPPHPCASFPPSYSPWGSGAWDLRLEPAAAARMESSGLFKSTLNIHRSKNKRASHSPRSLLRDPQG